MKNLLAFALCALFALNAGARTLYVDASRPNNKGNGLSAKKAKKTIQAAVNVSKKGDTIIVLKGKYTAPLKTNNRKIRIKSKSGAAATTILGKRYHKGFALDLGKGKATAATGLAIDGNGYEIGGVRGGTLSNCTLAGLGRIWDGPARTTFSGTKMTACQLNGCYTDSFGRKFMASCTLSRCKVAGTGIKNGRRYAPVASSKLANCLFADNAGLSFTSCVLANCTIAGNGTVALKGNKAYNTIFHKVSSSQFKSSRKNTLKNCYKGSDPKFVSTEDDDYRLAVGSPCLDKGTKASAAKKLYGKKDLAGNKRVQGKSVDIGCYEGAFDVYDDWDDGDLDHGVYYGSESWFEDGACDY